MSQGPEINTMLPHYLVPRSLEPAFLLEIRDMVRNVEKAMALSLICRVQRKNKKGKKKNMWSKGRGNLLTSHSRYPCPLWTLTYNTLLFLDQWNSHLYGLILGPAALLFLPTLLLFTPSLDTASRINHSMTHWFPSHNTFLPRQIEYLPYHIQVNQTHLSPYRLLEGGYHPSCSVLSSTVS